MCAEDEEGSLVSSVMIFSDSYFSGPEISVTGRKMKLRLFWRKRNLIHEGVLQSDLHHPLLFLCTAAVSGLSLHVLPLLLSGVLTSQLCSEAKLPVHSFPPTSFQNLVP